MNSVCIIPARGGSKRIPRKNLRNFLGKPIIAYSIETALKAGLFESVIVSTDDKEIADTAIQYGAEVPFMRSSLNSNDYAGTDDVILEVIRQLQKKGRLYDYVCCIYPTAPFITQALLKESFQKMVSGGYDAVFPVAKFSTPLQKALHIRNDKLTMIWPKNSQMRSQDFEPTYYDAGQFYWGLVDKFTEQRSLFTSNTGTVVLDDLLVQDIDNESDWRIAELKYQMAQHG